MSSEINKSPEKHELHPRNKHRERYNFDLLISKHPELSKFVSKNKYGDLSVDFFDPNAVKALNQALLYTYYNIEYWDIPEGYLCPPIPGRADYIHYIAELVKQLGNSNNTGKTNCLDIGIGANCIYPIIGIDEYDWNFVGTDIDEVSLASAQKIIDHHPKLQEKLELRLQKDSNHIFKGIILPSDSFDISVCNPPFHSSAEEARAGSKRKNKNLKGKSTKFVLTFGGVSTELWREGGEEKFIQDMIIESKEYGSQCRWFTTLVSKEMYLMNAYKSIKRIGAVQVETIPMQHGNKISRILAWSFQN